MKKLFLLLAILVILAGNACGQEQPEDLKIKVIPLSEKDIQETKDIYEQYAQALQKLYDHRQKLKAHYFSTASGSTCYSLLNNNWQPLPQFVISQDYRFLIVIKESSVSDNFILQYGNATHPLYTPLNVVPLGGGDRGAKLVFQDGKLTFSTETTPSTIVLPKADSGNE